MDAQTVFTVNGVTVDLGKGLLRDEAGQTIALRRQSFAVLCHLIAHADRLVTKDELVAAVWPGIAVTDDSLVQCIHEIRRALKDDAHAYLKTTPKRSYRLVLPPDAKVAANAGIVPARQAARRKRRIAAIAAGALGLAVPVALFAWFWAGPNATDAARDRSPAIAVLPFDNIGDGPKQSYFSDGVTEDLITDLSRIPGVVVIARNSVWAYKDKPVSPTAVARELGVRYVLRGSVRREGDRVRINAQLIDSTSGYQLWADRYDGTVRDVFAVQDQVVGNIVSALAVKLPRENVSAVDVETRNPQAYDALLLGMERLHLETDQDTLKAIAHFEKAAELDPDYSRAYAALAAAQLRIILSGEDTTAGAELDKAHASLRSNLAKAMQRPTSLAYTVAAEWALQTSRNDDAVILIDKAKALGQSDPEVLLSEASILNASGRAQEAEADVRLAMRLDPKFAPRTLRTLSVALFQQGKYWDAVEVIGRIKAQDEATMDDLITLVATLGQLGAKQGVEEGIDRYNELALHAGRSPMSVQEAQWRWHGDLFRYYRPYVDKLVEGLRKAGVLEGAGMDVSLDQYYSLIRRGPDGEFHVEGAPDLEALTAGGLFDRGVTFIDVRAPTGYASGHIPGAVNLPVVTDLSKEKLMKVTGPREEVVFYCHSRYCEDSAIAAAKAILWGYTRVYRLAGGVPAWERANCPVELTSAK
jgi:TolB-like protein/DNA-binding winged helix-turn-helix (wHTH) protein/rhodanese-related sulfurtransferase